MLEKTLEILKHEFRMTELDAGAYARQKVKGMTFLVHHYEVEGIGHLSTMAADGMFGLMKMDTVILVPRLKDAPLFSYDRIKAMGNDTFIPASNEPKSCLHDLGDCREGAIPCSLLRGIALWSFTIRCWMNQMKVTTSIWSGWRRKRERLPTF